MEGFSFPLGVVRKFAPTKIEGENMFQFPIRGSKFRFHL